MFNTFLADFNCPRCGKPAGHEQTKALACALFSWQLGDRVDIEGLVPARARMHVYDVCNDCDSGSMPGPWSRTAVSSALKASGAGPCEGKRPSAGCRAKTEPHDTDLLSPSPSSKRVRVHQQPPDWTSRDLHTRRTERLRTNRPPRPCSGGSVTSGFSGEGVTALEMYSYPLR